MLHMCPPKTGILVSGKVSEGKKRAFKKCKKRVVFFDMDRVEGVDSSSCNHPCYTCTLQKRVFWLVESVGGKKRALKSAKKGRFFDMDRVEGVDS